MKLLGACGQPGVLFPSSLHRHLGRLLRSSRWGDGRQVDGVDLLDHLGGICGWLCVGKVFLDEVLEADECPACKYSVMST